MSPEWAAIQRSRWQWQAPCMSLHAQLTFISMHSSISRKAAEDAATVGASTIQLGAGLLSRLCATRKSYHAGCHEWHNHDFLTIEHHKFAWLQCHIIAEANGLIVMLPALRQAHLLCPRRSQTELAWQLLHWRIQRSCLQRFW